MRGEVGEQVRVALEPVGPRPPAPGSRCEVDIDERPAIGVIAADRDARRAAVGSGGHAVGQHHRQRAEAAIRHAQPGEPARGARRREHRVRDGARWRLHFDGAKHALVVRDALGKDGPDRGVAGGLGERQRVVDRALDLRRGAGPVGDHRVAMLVQRDEQPDRLVEVDAVVVEEVLEAEAAVRQIPDRAARQPFGVVDDLLHHRDHAVGAIARDQVEELPLGDVAGRELRAQVAVDARRQTHVLLDDREQRFVPLSRRIELERRDAQPLLVDLGRVRRVGPRHAATHVGVMADGGGKRDPAAVDEERLEHENVGQVHPAFERIVEREDVARLHRVAVAGHHRGQRGRDRSQVTGQRQSLRHQLAVGVAEGGREIHVVLDHAGIRRADNRQRHLVGDREDRVLEELEGDRIALVAHPRPRGRPMTVGMVGPLPRKEN